MRVVAFFPLAIAYLSLLPLVARAQMADGPQFYGVLLGAIGVGTVGGTLALTRLTIEADSLAAVGAVGMAAALVIFGVSHEPISAIAACLLAGASWTVVLTNIYVSAQVALPAWARGRGLAVFLTFIFGATTAGSAVWGKLTEIPGLQRTYFAAAAALLIGIPLTGAGNCKPERRWISPLLCIGARQRQRGELKTTKVPFLWWWNIVSRVKIACSSREASMIWDKLASATAHTPGGVRNH